MPASRARGFLHLHGSTAELCHVKQLLCTSDVFEHQTQLLQSPVAKLFLNLSHNLPHQNNFSVSAAQEFKTFFQLKHVVFFSKWLKIKFYLFINLFFLQEGQLNVHIALCYFKEWKELKRLYNVIHL